MPQSRADWGIHRTAAVTNVRGGRRLCRFDSRPSDLPQPPARDAARCRFCFDLLSRPTGRIIPAMPAESANSFDDAMARLKTGEQDAARQVFERYVQRLIALASTRLGGKFRRKVDPEDVVQSVFNSFFFRQREDQYELSSWDGLWGLLAAITIHKCGHKIEHFQAACRDVAHEASPPVITDESRADWEAVARDPTASQVAILDETIVSLLRELDERSGQIFLLILQGWTTEEIGNEVQCSERTARRVLNRVHRRLEEVRDGK